MNEELQIFRAYQRGLLHQLQSIKETLRAGDDASADRMIDELIEDTRKNIEK